MEAGCSGTDCAGSSSLEMRKVACSGDPILSPVLLNRRSHSARLARLA